MLENGKGKKKTEKYPFGIEIEFEKSIVTIEERKEFLRIKVVDKTNNKEIFNKIIFY